MKRNFLFVVLAALTLAILPTAESFGQKMSKKDEKKWKKIAKNYTKNPAALKKITEEHRQYSRNNAQWESEIEQLKRAVDDKNNRIESLQAEATQLRNKVANMETMATQRPEPIRPTQPMNDDGEFGVWYKVQIGAYEDTRISQDLQGDNLQLEGEDSLQKIVIGNYRDYEDAKMLKDQLKNIGVKDAWVVSYRDGVRVPMEEVRNN